MIGVKSNRIQAIPNELSLLIGNFPSGYHRDMRPSMEILFPAIEELKACLQMTALMFTKIRISTDILNEGKHKYLISVEAVNELVSQGIPFGRRIKPSATKSLPDRFPSAIPNRCGIPMRASLGNLFNRKSCGK